MDVFHTLEASHMHLLDFFNDVYKPLRLIGRSPRTTVLYEYSIRLFSESVGRPVTLKDLEDIVVSKHLQRLLELSYSPHSVNKERSQLIAIWNLAARKKFVEQFPEIRPIKRPEIVPTSWTKDEMTRLRISCNYVNGFICGVPANRWWLALVTTIYVTGERITAVLSSRWEHLVDSTFVFPAENRKGATRANICHLPDYAIDALRLIREPKRELIFPYDLHPSSMYKQLSRILVRAELSSGRRFKFHCIRRTHATQLHLAGGNAQQSLGHTSPTTTAKYLDPTKMPDLRSMLPRLD